MNIMPPLGRYFTPFAAGTAIALSSDGRLIADRAHSAALHLSCTVSLHSGPSVAERFYALAERWQRDTSHLSSAHKLMTHPAYGEIVGLGPEVIPVLLREMATRPADWSWALERLTGADPVPEEDFGRLSCIAADWVAWGRQQGYVC